MNLIKQIIMIIKGIYDTNVNFMKTTKINKSERVKKKKEELPS